MKIKMNGQFFKVLIAVVVIILLGVLSFKLMSDWESKKSTVNSDDTSYVNDNSILFDGKNYIPKDSLETILVMGIDKYESQTDTEGYNNSQQADFLMLLVIDNDAKSYTALHINRDTMAEIPVLGVRGEDAGTVNAQLALAHTYGSGGSDSCRNTEKAVSDFLYDINIDHYVSLTMDAVAKINDMAGGVTVEMMDDFSAVYPQMVKGETVKLNGEMALTYVRSRKGLQDSTNIARMERQRQYLDALMENVIEIAAKDEGFYSKAFESISEYMFTDFTGNQLTRLLDKVKNYTNKGFKTIEGDAVKGEAFMEFYADETALKQLVLELFYAPKEQ